MQQENHKLPRAFAMATNAPLEPIVCLLRSAGLAYMAEVAHATGPAL